MIGEQQFELLSKKHAFVSNVGRGPIIKTDDLVKALEQEKIRGAAVDVTDPEPLPEDHPLWKAKNLEVKIEKVAAHVIAIDQLLGSNGLPRASRVNIFLGSRPFDL